MKKSLTTAAFVLLALCSRAESHGDASDWPQWRGPNRDGLVQDSAWPRQLKGALSKMWHIPLDPSYSGPIVVGDRVFSTETVDKRREVVRALDRQTGRELWRQEWEGAIRVPFFAKANGSWIRSTPACDGERLYVAGMRDVLVCLRVTDGSQLWRVDFAEALDTPLPSFGFVSSPLVDETEIYVQAGASVVCLNKQSGQILWRTLNDKGGMWGSAFSSPIISTLAGKRQLVVLTRKKMAGVRLADGKVLWDQPVKAFRGMNILTPVITDQGIFTAAYGGRTHLFDVKAAGDSYQVTERWNFKTQGYMSTPVVIKNHVWLHMRNQRVVCLDLRDGAEQWTTGRLFGKYWSQISNGERMLALDQRGILHLLETDPKAFTLLDSFKISDQETWAHLAVSNDNLFIRELNGLSAWRWSLPTVPEGEELSSK